MVELRKRKAPTQPAAAEKKSKSAPGPSEVDTTSQAPSQKVPKVDDILDLDNFGGEIETNDGSKTTLKKLVGESTSGVVLFTYPKASTPGCTSVLHHLGWTHPFVIAGPHFLPLSRHQAGLLVS